MGGALAPGRVGLILSISKVQAFRDVIFSESNRFLANMNFGWLHSIHAMNERLGLDCAPPER